MKKPTLVSLFTGAGGLDLGLEEAGFETVFANEIETYACESLRANRVLRSLDRMNFDRWFNAQITAQRCYKGMQLADLTRLRRRLLPAVSDGETYLSCAQIVERDIRALSAEDVIEATGLRQGEIDLVAGGPPCQPFSRAGKRELVECDTGQLFRDFVRIVTALHPRWFLFENVKGLILHKADVASRRCPSCKNMEIIDFELRNSIKEAEHIGATCIKCGFVGTHVVVWDKRKAGSLDIIQNEFARAGYSCQSVVLNAADFGAPQRRERLFIVGSRDGEVLKWPKATHNALATPITTPTLFDALNGTHPRWETVNGTLYTSGHWHYGQLDPAKAVLWVKNVVRPHDEPVTWPLDRPAPTIGAHQAAKLAIAPYGVPDAQLQRQQWHVLGRRQGDTAPVTVEHEYLTDEELLALQTFPSSWYLYGTRMERAFQIGNAVPPVLAKFVGEAILRAMDIKTCCSSKPKVIHA